MLTLSFNILTCVYLWIKAMKKLNDNLIKEEDFGQCYRSTQLKRWKSTGRDSRGFAQEKTTNSFDKYDTKRRCKHTCTAAPDHLDKLLCNLQCFFFKDQRKKDRSNFEPFTMSSFPKTPASCALASEYLQCY